MPALAALVAGLLFGFGLILSGMINPQKVLNFLDLFGHWDPSLAFVMGGAILVGVPGFRLLDGRSRPLFSTEFHLPSRTDLTPGLITGSVLFGVGWGLSGYCPGPAISGLATFNGNLLLFLAAMVVGMLIGKALFSRNIPRNRSVDRGTASAV